VFDVAGALTGLGRALSSAALSLPLRPRRPRLAATRTGQNRGVPESTLHTLTARFGSLARGLVDGPRFTRLAGRMAKSSDTDFGGGEA